MIIQKSSEHLIHDLWEYFAKQSSLYHFVCNNLHNFLQAKAYYIIYFFIEISKPVQRLSKLHNYYWNYIFSLEKYFVFILIANFLK